MTRTKEYTASIEDYLEAIALLSEDKHAARVSEISRALQVTMPSVSAALKKLSEEGLVEHERYGYVRLTNEGKRIADDVWWRHETLRRFLVEVLDVVAETADEDACRMEHSLSPDSLERLAKFLDFTLSCPRGEPEWLKGWQYFLEHGERNEERVTRCLRDST